jgi:hypothetical protein
MQHNLQCRIKRACFAMWSPHDPRPNRRYSAFHDNICRTRSGNGNVKGKEMATIWKQIRAIQFLDVRIDTIQDDNGLWFYSINWDNPYGDEDSESIYETEQGAMDAAMQRVNERAI